jgi:hypothetical protein
MGTTLTGTTPQDTYDSLIKVTDNGPISGTLKALSDGLGNDSTLSLSTTAASIAGTLAVTGNATFDTNTLFVDAAANQVGVGTITPKGKLDVLHGLTNPVGLGDVDIDAFRLEGGGITAIRAAQYDSVNQPAAGDIQFLNLFFNGSSYNYYERARITAAGNVGIGTSSPQQKLHVSNVAANSYAFLGTSTNWGVADTNRLKLGSTGDTFTLGCDLRANTNYAGTTETSLGIWATNGAGTMVEVVRATANGLTFNGDTAAANALDDYEEGTFTATLKGSVSDPTTPVTTTGTYTKIGRQVTVNVIFSDVNTTGANGDVSITGMPFTASGISNGSVSCFQFTFPSNTSLASYIGATATTVEILISGTNANWGALSHSAGGSRFLWTTITYFV